MSITLQKLQIRAAAAAAAAAAVDDIESHPSHITSYSDTEDVSDRIHKIERELADLPPNSPLRSNFQAILKDYKNKGQAGLMYQNGRTVGDFVNPDLKRGPVYVERCSISIMSDGEIY
ncbi:hypothetical protein TWF106_005135 [Orbilia oligospora]|uniref:Uncharacterized protein n=1 Tax=Orbilia oligospora TaxID=2813651 RepID=A0A6G1M2M0_ORBOL|nr:hypothetical protein TWF788_001008 [Orbilia oligospora]KAF3204428.1 hypothetical protein TWF191_002260 [Orbilia oligospora]KAF3211315.1 hypothetical protein TWF679_006479 [Orbilia oligospora]KAF3223363.1 hypothetical protein TWF106_005135 [Orbilia oligospora]KAF3242218.1 hypothetical protein TWF192_008705 [Orbilia oligospora]